MHIALDSLHCALAADGGDGDQTDSEETVASHMGWDVSM